jgi:DNA-binding response OmpR family regulator
MKKILVIEDEELLRSELIKVLGFEGYEAIGAGNGRDGVLSAQTNQPHLIICDLSMPALDGFGVITQLSHDPHTAAIPVILLSGHADQDAVQQGLQMGAADYLVKPYILEKLLASVRTHVGI